MSFSTSCTAHSIVSGDDVVPPPQKFSELVNSDDLSFKIKIEGMIEKLKKMEDTSNTPENFEHLMHSFITKTKQERDELMEIDTKVKMVDNLVEMFIEGNALRAQKMKEGRIKSPRKEIFPPRRTFTDLINKENLNQKEYDFEIGSTGQIQGVLPNERQNPLLGLLKPTGNDEKEKHQLQLPAREKQELLENLMEKPEDFTEDILILPQTTQNEIFSSLLEQSENNVQVVEKLAPLTEQRNPLLRILKPNDKDSADKNNLRPPAYKQDPFLRQLAKNPTIYSEDFLELPQVKQDEIIDIIKTEEKDFGIESIVNVDEERNPLQRLLLPNNQDNYDKNNLLPPAYRQNPLLRQLKNDPDDYNEDFLELPMKMQDQIIEVLEKNGLTGLSIGKLAKGNRNPLLRLLSPNFQDNKDKDNLELPKSRQDPLLKQLKSHVENYKDDILQLPSRKQDILLKILKKEGIPDSQINGILPPHERQNPLLKLLDPNFKDEIEKQQLTLPKYKQDPLLRQLITAPKDYSEDFLQLPLKEQDDIIEVIENVDPKFFNSNELAPLKVERNPLKRLLQPNNNDNVEKNQLKPPNYRQNPLLRQLASSPMNFEDDILELPKQLKISLIEQLQQIGVRQNVLDHLKILSQDEYPNLKELFSIKSKEELEEKILKVVREKPLNYARIFSNLFHHSNLFDFHHTKNEIQAMIEDDPEAVAVAFSQLIHDQQEKFGELETSTPKLSLPLKSILTTAKPSLRTQEPSKVKVLRKIIKKPKEGSIVKNSQFTDDKIQKLKDSVKPTDQTLSSEVVYKTKEGRIIPKENIKLDGNQDEEFFFPDKKIKLVKERKNEQLSSPKAFNKNIIPKTRGPSNDLRTLSGRYGINNTYKMVYIL